MTTSTNPSWSPFDSAPASDEPVGVAGYLYAPEQITPARLLEEVVAEHYINVSKKTVEPLLKKAQASGQAGLLSFYSGFNVMPGQVTTLYLGTAWTGDKPSDAPEVRVRILARINDTVVVETLASASNNNAKGVYKVTLQKVGEFSKGGAWGSTKQHGWKVRVVSYKDLSAPASSDPWGGSNAPPPVPPSIQQQCDAACAGRGGCSVKVAVTTSSTGSGQQVSMLICANGDILESPPGKNQYVLVGNASGLANLDVFGGPSPEEAQCKRDGGVWMGTYCGNPPTSPLSRCEQQGGLWDSSRGSCVPKPVSAFPGIGGLVGPVSFSTAGWHNAAAGLQGACPPGQIRDPKTGRCAPPVIVAQGNIPSPILLSQPIALASFPGATITAPIIHEEHYRERQAQLHMEQTFEYALSVTQGVDYNRNAMASFLAAKVQSKVALLLTGSFEFSVLYAITAKSLAANDAAIVAGKVYKLFKNGPTDHPGDPGFAVRLVARKDNTFIFDMIDKAGNSQFRFNATLTGSWSRESDAWSKYTPHVQSDAKAAGFTLRIDAYKDLSQPSSSGGFGSGPKPPPTSSQVCENACFGLRGGCAFIKMNTVSATGSGQMVTQAFCKNGDVMESAIGSPLFTKVGSVAGLGNVAKKDPLVVTGIIPTKVAFTPFGGFFHEEAASEAGWSPFGE